MFSGNNFSTFVTKFKHCLHYAFSALFYGFGFTIFVLNNTMRKMNVMNYKKIKTNGILEYKTR